jgi:hypothetical protein
MIRRTLIGVGVLIVVLIVLSFPYVEEAWSDPEGRPRMVAALLGVAGTAVTAFVAFGLWMLQHRADRKAEQARRRDRQHRMMIALRAELGLNAKAQYDWFAPERSAGRKETYLTEMQAADGAEHSMPMAVVSQTNEVFDNLKDEIADLPGGVIAAVIAYYQQDEYVSQLLARFSDGTFEKVSVARRERAIEALFTVGRSTLAAAIIAFMAVDEALIEEGIPASADMERMRRDITQMGHILADRTSEQAETT